MRKQKRASRSVTIDNITGDEREAIARALKRPDVRAFAIVIGLLEPLSPRGRERVMAFIADRFDERMDVP